MLRTALLALALFACKSSSREEPKPAQKVAVSPDVVARGSDDDSVVQPRFAAGAAVPTDEGKLGLTITKVHTGQQPAEVAPFYAAGGDWTFVEAHVDGDPAATFVVGMPPFAAGTPSFSKTTFAPTTREAGARVISHLARALATAEPPVTPGGVLEAMRVPIAVLGHGIGRRDNGYGGRGTWEATKLFCSAGGIEAAELFFNIDIAGKRGELAEKDTDYNRDIVACLAVALRDGTPPTRTPDNDPTLSTTGPRLEIGKRIGGPRMEELALTPARLWMIEERGTSAAIVEVDVKTGTTKDLFTTEDRLTDPLGYGRCDATPRCVIKISTPKDRNIFSNDPSRLVVLDDGKVTPVVAPALGDRPGLARQPISPDGRIVVGSVYDKQGDTWQLVAVNRKTKQTVTLAVGGKESIDVVEWVRSGGTWIAVVTKQATWDDDAPVTVLDWHVEARGVTKPSQRAVPDEVSPWSPDGKRRAELTKDGKLTVTIDGKPRTLVFHPEDAKLTGPGCCAWIDNRLMQMPHGYIDTNTMKVGHLPKPSDGEQERVVYVRGTRTAIMIREDGVYLANLVGP